MNSIKTMSGLLDALAQVSPDKYVELGSLLNIPRAEFEPYIFWDSNGYTRNCIERTADYELLLLCWQAGDETPVHCHGEQRCWVYQVDGTLEERLFKSGDLTNPKPDDTRILGSGGVSYMDDSLGYHSLHNNTKQQAISLHLYAKPIDSCTYFDSNAQEFVSQDLSYHSYKGELNESVHESA